MTLRTLGITSLLIGAFAATTPLHAQDERLMIHGSANIASGKTDSIARGCRRRVH